MTMMMNRKALEDYGLVNLGNINWNLSPAVLVEHALARGEGRLAANGALASTTGVHTGRSPKDKFIVSNNETNAKIWWGENNHPAGTEAGVTTPEASFSSCFGGAFLPLRPGEDANLLRERIEKHSVRCYLINTGWTGGPYGVGERININYTRAMVRAAISGDIDQAEMETDTIFGLRSPRYCPDVPASVLIPRNTWSDKDAYDQQARSLAERFKQNFTQFDLVTDEVRNAGPR